MKRILSLLFLLSFSVHSNTITFDCKYTKYSEPNGVKKVKDKFDLSFIMDDETGKSYILGNNGSNELIAIGSQSQLSFIEVTGTKNVMVTTIDEELKSVHSRNSVMFGKLIPSQYYGTCVKK